MSNKLQILLDLDGVNCSWLDGVLDLFDVNDETARSVLREKLKSGQSFEQIGFDQEDINKKVHDAGYDFWMNLELFPWAKNLYSRLNDFSKGNVTFCTSQGQWAIAASAKVEYVGKHFNTNRIIITKEKAVLAAPNLFLVDDSQYQIKPFIRDGGGGFLWPNQYVIEDGDPKINYVDRVLQAVQDYSVMNGLVCIEPVRFEGP